MKLKSSRLMVGGLVAVTVMALTAAVLPLSLSWVNQARHERDAVDQRLGGLKEVMELLVDAETGERGYVITGREAFLQPYHAALSALPQRFDLLQQRYASVAPQERQLVDELVRAGQRRLVGLSEIVGLRQEGGFAAAEPLVSAAYGKIEMDRVRTVAGELVALEVRELGLLNASLEKKIWWSIAISLGSTALTLLLLAYLARTMVRSARAGQAAAAQAQHTSAQLALGMETLKRRNEQVSTLSEMARLLQAEMSLVEALEVASVFAGRLMPHTAGAVYLFRNSADLLELAASWGGGAGEAATIAPSACWGIRRGQMHRQHRPGDMRCAHCEPDAVRADAGRHHTCLPLMAYGESLGLLHVSARHESEPGAEATAEMALVISEQVALSLSNAKLRQVLRDQSIRDPLTGWYNRRYMEETLQRELARAQRQKTPLSLVIADLDHFKKINDAHGHPAGDAVLRAATRHLATMVRASDVACRYGGEEFVLILPDCDKESALQRSQHMCDALRALIVRDGGQAIAVTASFGVASMPQDGGDAATLFEAADAAVYQAKRSGRDRVVCAGPLVVGA